MFVFSAFLCMLFCPMTGATEAKASEVSVTSLQNYTIKFCVLDENKDPLPGVTVRVKGSDIAASSDVDGNVSIDVPSADAMLVLSYVGYIEIEMQAINISGRRIIMTPVNISLQ